MSDIIENLMRLGMSQYEARAYVATLVLGEGTIKEISDESKVPRSRAYDVMERLLEKGFVEVGNTNPRCYRANDPAEVFGHILECMERARDEVVKALEAIGSTAERRENPIWTIKGEWAIDRKVAELMRLAKREIVIISIRNEYLRRYARNVTLASERIPVTVLMLESSNELKGMLGRARTLIIGKGKLSPPDPFMSHAMERLEKGMEYDVELLMVCDRKVSVILSKERVGHRAIISKGTVLDHFINRMVDLTIGEAEGM